MATASKGQFAALFRKSWTSQKRQKRTNLALVLLPGFLLVILFIIQNIIDSFTEMDTIELRYPPLEIRGLGLRTPNCDFFLQTGRDAIPSDLRLAIVNRSGVNLGSFSPFSPGSVASFLDWVPRNGSYSLRGTDIVTDIVFRRDFCDGIPAVLSVNGLTEGRLPNATVFAQPSEISLSAQTFASVDEFDEVAFDNDDSSMSYLAGVIVEELDTVTPQMHFTYMYNDTLTRLRDYASLHEHFGSYGYQFLDGSASGAAALGLEVTTSFLRDMPAEVGFQIDISAFIGPSVFTVILLMFLPSVVTGIVYDREQRLHEIMKMMGLNGIVYWQVTFLFNWILSFVIMMIFFVLSSAFGFGIIVDQSPGVVFVTLFLWSVLLVVFGIFLSTLFSSTSLANVVSYLILFLAPTLGATFLTNLGLEVGDNIVALNGWSILAPLGIQRVLIAMGNGVLFGGTGLDFSDVTDPDVGVAAGWGIMILDIFLYAILAWYLGEVHQSEYGVAKGKLFFLDRWRKNKKKKKPVSQAAVAAANAVEMVPMAENGEQTLFPSMSTVCIGRERSIDAELEKERVETNPLQFACALVNAVKTFHAGGELKAAVDHMYFGVDKGQCVAITGSNGAGKSTATSLVSGLYPPDSGDIFIDGISVVKNTDEARGSLGVCAQGNLLWEVLTGPDHLRFYGTLRGFKGNELEKAIDSGLKDVNLYGDRTKLVREYSGGMKRRLCVACAFIGNPKLVLLDEPTTGLDPASRRELWKLIERQRLGGAAIWLTSHSMEECERLAQRLVVMHEGQLDVVDVPRVLTQRLGQSIKIHMVTRDPERALALVASHWPTFSVDETFSHTTLVSIPEDQVSIPHVFRVMDAESAAAGVDDWSVRHASLHDVFVDVATQAIKKSEKRRMGGIMSSDAEKVVE